MLFCLNYYNLSTYTVEEGTTWGAWANSTEGKWTVAEDGKIKCNEGLATEEYIGYEGEAESSSDPISSSGEYDIVITFKIADVAYTATKGMSWIAWVESTYYESEPWELGADNSCVFVYETGCYVGEVTQPNRFFLFISILNQKLYRVKIMKLFWMSISNGKKSIVGVENFESFPLQYFLLL